MMELRPVHDALRHLLEPEIVGQLADFAEHARGALAADRKTPRERNEFLELAWTRFEPFVRAAQQAYWTRAGRPSEHPQDPAHLSSGFQDCVRKALHIPAVETLFAAPWPAPARHALPSASPRHSGTALWGPVFSWCALELLSGSINQDAPRHTALDVFDRLRLREPFAQAFTALGMESEEGWRAVARIKVLLLARNSAGEPKAATTKPTVPPAVALDRQKPSAESAADLTSPKTNQQPVIVPALNGSAASSTAHVPFAASLWHDPDVRWLTGTHEAEGHNYLVKEPYEELLWWLQLPALLRLAGEPSPQRSEAEAITRSVDEAVAAVAAAGYRADRLLAFDRRARKEEAPVSRTAGRDADPANGGSVRPAKRKSQEPHADPPLKPETPKKH